MDLAGLRAFVVEDEALVLLSLEDMPADLGCGEGLAVDLLWAERGGPSVVQPQRRGFGSRLLAASAQQIKGEHEMDFAPTGLQGRLRFVVLPETLWTARAG